LPAGGSRVVAHGLLCYSIAFSCGPCKYLGVDEGAGACQLDIIKDFGFVQLEGTIDVAEFEAEEQADELCPAEAVEPAKERVAAVEAIATDYVVFVHQGQERRHFCDVELAVSIGVKDEVFCGGVKARAQRGAISEIFLVVDDFYGVVGGGDLVGDLAGFVGAAIVNDDDLEVGVELLEDGERLFGGLSKVVLLVVTGEKDAD